MKKFSRILITLGMTVMLLAGCTNASQPAQETKVSVRVGSLKGPTTIGLLQLMDEAEQGKTALDYSFTMATQADELAGKLLTGDLDIALIPANLAANLYWGSNAKLQIIDVNTLGVLYLVSRDSELKNIGDLKGRTIYLTGKGTSPDIVLQYLLKANGISTDDVTLEYKTEATEVAAVLTTGAEQSDEAVGVLPQPFVTVACAQDEELQVVMDLTKEWEKVQQDGSSLVTGVTVANREFIENHPDAVEAFLTDHRNSVDYINGNVDQAAAWAVAKEIIAKEPVARKAIPGCNVVCITGADMKQALGGYFMALYEANPKVVGEPAVEPKDALWDDLYYGVH